MRNIKQVPAMITFAEVATQGSFTHAAKVLGLSKSTVSQHVSSLEEQVGVQLLQRHTRGIALTAMGQKLLARCEMIRDQMDLAFLDLSQAEQGPKGKFSVVFPPPLEKNIMIPAIAQLCREFPGIEPEITVTLEKRDLVKHNLDVAVFGGEPKISNYRALPISTSSECFCASPEYLIKQGSPNSTKALEAHPWIALEWQVNPITIAKLASGNTSSPEQYDSLQLKQYAKVNSVTSAVELTLQHLGIVLLPNHICQPLIQAGKLVQLVPEYRGPVWPFYFIHAYHAEKPVHISRFYQLVKHYFAKAQVE